MRKEWGKYQLFILLTSRCWTGEVFHKCYHIQKSARENIDKFGHVKYIILYLKIYKPHKKDKKVTHWEKHCNKYDKGLISLVSKEIF